MKVYWTEAAVADLDAIHAYISHRSERYAAAMVRRIVDRANSLSDHPLIGSVVLDYERESVRELIQTPYRIIYRVLPERVDIVAIVHAARLLPPDLPATP